MTTQHETPTTTPREQKGNAALGCLALIAIAGVVIAILAAVGNSGGEYDPPNDKYTLAECQGLRVVALENGNPNASDAAVQYKLYCQ